MPEEDDNITSPTTTTSTSTSTNTSSPHLNKDLAHTQNLASHSTVWSPVPVNTHLKDQRRLALNSYHSMADLRLTDEDVKKRKYGNKRKTLLITPSID